MYRDRDFDLEQDLPPHAEALTQDLELHTLLEAMAGGDTFFLKVAAAALLQGLPDHQAVLYRQAALQDCLRNYPVVRGLYDLAVDALEDRRRHWFGITGLRASGVLYETVAVLQAFVGTLAKLKQVADEEAAQFRSQAFRGFFRMVQAELTDDYLATLKDHLRRLHFKEGVLVSAQLGEGNKGTSYLLRQTPDGKRGLLEWLRARRSPAYTYHLDPRDEAGARALTDLRNEALARVAETAYQSAEHVRRFLVTLRTELAFYLGCAGLHEVLTSRGVPLCFPVPTPVGAGRYLCRGLRDVCLALRQSNVVGNDMEADDQALVVITGANQGGKSTFLRSLGLAQVMMQAGLFVTAESFGGDMCTGLFTHFSREEDAAMESGRLDEELSRLSSIADALTPGSLLLMNESFSSSNEREGSEIARQVIAALRGQAVRAIFVTHLHEFARGLWEQGDSGILFLRAEREADGRRTFRLVPGEPLQTSFGADLYAQVFGAHRVGMQVPGE